MSLLEVTRAAHEQVERLERLAAMSMSHQTDPGEHHRVRSMIHQIVVTTRRLIEIYQDKDDAMKDEMAALAGNCSYYNDNNVFSEFFHRVKEIRDYHRRHNPDATTEDDDEFTAFMPTFTGDEAFGRCLDLHELYNTYINSSFGNHIDYSSYLCVFSETETIPRELKLTRQYREYMQKLVQYLVSFLERTQPLKDVETIRSKVVDDLDDDYTTVEQLMGAGVGSEKALSALGLKTGGTKRLLLTKEVALMEAKMKKLCNMLSATISNTKENIDKKYASTHDEIVREQLEEGCDSESDHCEYDDDERIYNPLKLPMGWDGKPIPYWLYKLHGLGQKFKCEICGDHTYRGRREYERHFKELRHRAGLKCLGIPNSKSFDEITSIKEAKQLWETLQEKRGLKRWRPELEEEYEDEEATFIIRRHIRI